jgi:hypothetical protein
MSEPQPAQRRNVVRATAIALLAAVAAYIFIFYLVRPFEVELALQVQNIHICLLALATTSAFLVVARQFDWLDTKPGRIMLLIASGFASWTIAETVWYGYQLVGVDPFPSVADAFYIAAYFPFVAAMALNLRAIPVKFTRLGLILWVITSALAAILISWLIVIPVAIAGEDFSVIVSVVYPIEDWLVLVLVLATFVKLVSGEVARPWALLLLGFVIQVFADLLFAYSELLGVYLPVYDPSDLLYSLGYLVCLASAIYFAYLFQTSGGTR